MCPFQWIALRMVSGFFDVMAGYRSDGRCNIECCYGHASNAINRGWANIYTNVSTLVVDIFVKT